MLKLLLLVLAIDNLVSMCKWVCNDKNNDLDKYLFDESKIFLEIPNLELDITNLQRKDIKIRDITLKMPEYDVQPMQANCGAQFKQSIKDNVKRIKCKPRYVIVDIKYKGAQKISPNKISTKLCTGICNANRTCESLQRKNVTVAITVIDYFNKAQCSNVVVPEDTKCRCGCGLKTVDCLSMQVLDKKLCKCKCINKEDKEICFGKMSNNVNKYEWNKNSCTCQCKKQFICSTGTRWDEGECQCVRYI